MRLFLCICILLVLSCSSHMTTQDRIRSLERHIGDNYYSAAERQKAFQDLQKLTRRK